VTPAEEELEVKSKKRKKSRHAEVDEMQVEKAIRETLAEMVDARSARVRQFGKRKRGNARRKSNVCWRKKNAKAKRSH
jgi:tRNA A37 N6-isopentenylltransferase MiaA